MLAQRADFVTGFVWKRQANKGPILNKIVSTGPGQGWDADYVRKTLALNGAGQTARLSAQVNKNSGGGRHRLPRGEAPSPTTSSCKSEPGRKSPCEAREAVTDLSAVSRADNS